MRTFGRGEEREEIFREGDVVAMREGQSIEGSFFSRVDMVDLWEGERKVFGRDRMGRLALEGTSLFPATQIQYVQIM